MLRRLKAIIPHPYKRLTKRLIQNIYESITYGKIKKSPLTNNMRHIIFVCKGNICRSAFAEYYLVMLNADINIRVESFGLDVDQGIHSPLEAIKVGREFGVELNAHCSKGFTACDLQRADLIVPMEFGQYLQLTSMLPNSKKKVRLLRDFSPWPSRLMCNIYDPFGLGEDEFRRCFQKMKLSLDGLKLHISASRKQ
jgi:protein-tyrosine phosphatase